MVCSSHVAVAGDAQLRAVCGHHNMRADTKVGFQLTPLRIGLGALIAGIVYLLWRGETKNKVFISYDHNDLVQKVQPLVAQQTP